MNGEEKGNETIKAEVEPEESTALSFAPGSLSDLANRLGQGIEIIKARAEILQIARKAALRMTSPEDFLLFKDPQGRVVAYLQDCGCDRVRDIFGISVFNVSKPDKLPQSDGSFTYVVTGSGRCSLTQQVVEDIEGGRSSTDDFITRANPPLTGAAMELAVRKAARANLDGNITRELAGLKSVPLEEIEAAYQGDAGKTRARFREGRGFGKKEERTTQGEMPPDHVESPKCPKCNVEMVLRKGTGSKGPYAFWGCPNFKSKNCKETIQDSDWQKQVAARAQANGAEKEVESVPEQLLELQKLIVAIVNADKTQTPDGLCRKYFKLKAKGTEPAKELVYSDVQKLHSTNQLGWIHGVVKQIRKDFVTVLPPEEPEMDEPTQEEFPL